MVPAPGEASLAVQRSPVRRQDELEDCGLPGRACDPDCLGPCVGCRGREGVAVVAPDKCAGGDRVIATRGSPEIDEDPVRVDPCVRVGYGPQNRLELAGCEPAARERCGGALPGTSSLWSPCSAHRSGRPWRRWHRRVVVAPRERFDRLRNQQRPAPLALGATPRLLCRHRVPRPERHRKRPRAPRRDEAGGSRRVGAVPVGASAAWTMPRSSLGITGFIRKWTPSSLSACLVRSFNGRPDIRTIGVQHPRLRSRRTSSTPSWPGMLTSMTMKSNLFVVELLERDRGVHCTRGDEPVVPKRQLEDALDPRFVVDDQDSDRCIHRVTSWPAEAVARVRLCRTTGSSATAARCRAPNQALGPGVARP